MNYYLLSVTNDFASDGLCKEIAISLSPIVDSPNLKFHYTRNQIIFSFGAETEKSEIYEYITGVLYGLVEIFVLTEIVDDFSVSLPKDIKDHLFDLENVGENVTMKLDMERIKKNLDFSFEEDEEDDENDIMSLIIRNKDVTPNPTLDQILDKLYSEGMDSLSSKEKTILETYSQN
jgi:regulator of replication initiation timing